MSSATISPSTDPDSAEPSSRKSTPPSSPLAQTPDNKFRTSTEEGSQGQARENMTVEEEEEEDEEDMDHKSRALTNLLKTSSVCRFTLWYHALVLTEDRS